MIVYEHWPKSHWKTIKKVSRKCHLSQEDLSEQIGVTSKFYSLIENGQRGMSIETLVKLKNSLNLDLNYLLTGEISECVENPIIKMINDFDSLDRGYSERILELLQDIAARRGNENEKL